MMKPLDDVAPIIKGGSADQNFWPSLEVTSLGLGLPRYCICTVVTNHDEYQEMLGSFRLGGFDETTTEFLHVDNSAGNRVDAFEAYNLFLRAATASYVILCHQDVVLMNDGISELDAAIEELSAFDENWALFGNAGCNADGSLILRISDPNGGEDQSVGGPFPVRVLSLDENFIVARASANLALSHDLAGFHMYGADLCILADVLGFNAYVVDFHLRHKSPGTVDAKYYAMKAAARRKYQRAFRFRRVPLVTRTPLFLTGSYAVGLASRVAHQILSRLPRRRRR